MSAGERTRYYQIRPRRLPPEFASDELLEECSVLAALLLTRLISLADDQGRLQGHPRSVRATAFPMRPEITERKVKLAIDELFHAGFVIRYDVAGRTYLQIARWFDMQGKWGQRRTYPSRFPAPPGWDSDWVTAGSEADEVRALGAQDARDVPPPTSLSSSSSSSLSSALPGLPRRGGHDSDAERLGDLIERAKRGLLSEQESFELGTALASNEQASEVEPQRAPSGPMSPRESGR